MQGPLRTLFADIVASHDCDFLCLTETHVHPYDTDSFLHSITPPDFVFIHTPHPPGIDGSSFFTKCSHKPSKIDSPLYQSFENSGVNCASWSYTLI